MIGTATDEKGRFEMQVPEGAHTIIVRALGFKPHEKQVILKEGETIHFSVEVKEDVLGLEQVVVTADRNSEKRKESSIIVNTLNNAMLEAVQSANLSEGLAYSPGLRIENNCGNCGANSLRMNGLDGPYTQILINGRPIFSGLAAVYGLELIPSNMIERIEVVRGGGSALYGSNAIAVTVNVITREPANNQYSISAQTSSIGSFLKDAKPGTERQINFNSTITGPENKTGLAVYGSIRNRQAFDANNDGFSELSKIENSTIGTQWSLRTGYKSKLVLDLFHINEARRGGDRFDYPLHEAWIAEAADHNINSGNISWTIFTGGNQQLTTFAAVQDINRDSYYGAGKALDAYGKTDDLSFSGGVQYKFVSGGVDIIAGAEINGGNLLDKKLGNTKFEVDQNTSEIKETEVPGRIIANQNTLVSGAFAQIERKIGEFSISGGLRFDRYNISDRMSDDKISNHVLSPRITMLYGLTRAFQLRASYAKGYRAPQIFDEDLHIETSDSRQVIHMNDPGLKQETSHSFTGSLSYIREKANSSVELLAEFFYTNLQNPFANDIGLPDSNGRVTYTRVNEKQGAIVQGVNMEVKWAPGQAFNLNAGFTIQTSEYGAPQNFNETRFFRTPDNYGFFTLNWKPKGHWEISSNATYTGTMLVPYFGPLAPDPEVGLLKKSAPFFDLSAKLSYCLETNMADLDLFMGIKNIFNSYQSDFDEGKYRDPGYVYGPISPRSVYGGIKISNIL